MEVVLVNFSFHYYIGWYPYMPDLLCLQAATPSASPYLPPELRVVHSPLHDHLDAWRTALGAHPDLQFASYILAGIQYGFRIGFSHRQQLVPAIRNAPSATEHPEVVEQYLTEEISAGRIIGPFSEDDIPGIQISRMGVIPKGHTPGRWRLITDLSFPPGSSVNDGIDSELCSLQYTSVEKVARVAQRLGRGKLLAKLDVQAAYRLVPIHPDDRPLLGVRWGDACYFDGMLPFGLRSAPKIFTSVADSLEWCLRQSGVTHIDHYLDDYITMGAPGTSECQHNLSIMLDKCEALGVPIAPEKLVGPSSCLTFLGIEIDTDEGVMRLPAEKLARIQSQVCSWSQRQVCRRRQLESLIGLLQHACRVVRPGRSFLRHMISLLSHSYRPYHHICLTKQFRADLCWWHTFLPAWNGVFVLPPQSQPSACFASDASGQWGCGAWWDARWFQFRWPQSATSYHISFLELVAVLMACAVWGPMWRGRTVLCWCDNQAAVCAIAARSCQDAKMMHLLRCLFFLEAFCQFELVASHVPGIYNGLADDLSRNRLSSFLSKIPQASKEPTAIPPQLPQVLLDPGLDWTLPSWTQWFNSIVRMDSQPPPTRHTE